VSDEQGYPAGCAKCERQAADVRRVVSKVFSKHKRFCRKGRTKAGEVVAAALLQIESEILSRLEKLK